MPNALAVKSCTPCRGGIPPLTIEEAQGYLPQAPDWDLLDDGRKIQRTYRFMNFREALGFVQRAGELAEAEGHHPDCAELNLSVSEGQAMTEQLRIGLVAQAPEPLPAHAPVFLAPPPQAVEPDTLDFSPEAIEGSPVVMHVAIYGRVSTSHLVDHQTIEQQLGRLTAHVRSHASEGWVLDPAHIFRDDGCSGAMLARSGLDCLRDAVKVRRVS